MPARRSVSGDSRVRGFAVPAIPSADVRQSSVTLRGGDPGELTSGGVRPCCYRAMLPEDAPSDAGVAQRLPGG